MNQAVAETFCGDDESEEVNENQVGSILSRDLINLDRGGASLGSEGNSPQRKASTEKTDLS